MKIKHRFRYVKGDMDTDTDQLISVGKKKYGEVLLCVKSNMNIPIAQIRLHSKDLAIEADAVFEDAEKLGEEIARRWNQAPKFESLLKDALIALQCNPQQFPNTIKAIEEVFQK